MLKKNSATTAEVLNSFIFFNKKHAMKNCSFISMMLILLVSCRDSNKQTVATSVVDSNGARYVNWEMGDAGNVSKIMEFYKFWDAKNFSAANEFFADTVRVILPTVREEIVVPNNEVSKRLAANRDTYRVTSNDILSSVALHDKVTGEDWVMITAYSKWVDEDGKKDSIVYHDDWRLVNGKVDKLISFHTLPPKNFVPKKDQ